MFTNLIESESHVREFKRRSSFFLITVMAYAVILFAAGIASVYAYDAQLEAQTSSLELLNWVPPVERVPAKPPSETRQPTVRKPPPSSAPVDPTARTAERTAFVAGLNDPNKVPEGIGVKPVDALPYRQGAVLSNRNVDPPTIPISPNACITCGNEQPRVKTEDKPPEPEPIKPPTTLRVTDVMNSRAISLPQPPYPQIAKQTGIKGRVNVQILIDEHGKVISAQSVSGHPFLATAAKDAAMRARFTPTTLNGVPVKVQGVIIYNFVLQ